MREMKEMNINLKGGCGFARVTRSFEDGSMDEKKVILSDLVAIINNSAANDSYIPIGPLPYGYYKGCISPFDPSTFKVAMIMPGEKRILTYFKEEHQVPFPDLLFLFAAEHGRLTKTQVFSVVTKKGQRQIANYPYGNVHAGGKICWGQNSLPAAYTMKESEQVVGLFFGSETNDDLYEAGRCVIKKKEFFNQRGLILKAEEKRKFPEQWLKQTGEALDGYVERFLIS